MSFPRYPEYKDPGVDWLEEVPAHWEAVRLKRMVRRIESGTSVNSIDTPAADGEYGVLKTSCVYRGEFDENENKAVVPEEYDRVSCPLRAETLLVSRMNTPDLVGAAGLVRFARPGIFLPDRLWQVHLSGLNPAFAHYWTQTEIYRHQVKAACSGTSSSMQNLSQEQFRGFQLAAPPLAEQTAIVSFLDRETTKIDALVAEQQRLIALLSEKRQAVISHAVTKGLSPDVPMKDSGVEWLGEVPAHWEVTRVGNLFIEVSESGETDLPVLSVSIHHGVSDRELGEQELDRKVSRSEDRTKYKRVRPGDLVYNMMRAWQGAFGAVAVDGMVSPAYVVARPRQRVSTFVELLLRTPKAIEEMRRFSNGVTDFRLRLYWPEFKNIRITLPPPQEMEAICDYANRVSAEFSALIEASNESVMLLNERRTALISAAVTGKIDVRGLADIKTTSPEARDVEPA